MCTDDVDESDFARFPICLSSPNVHINQALLLVMMHYSVCSDNSSAKPASEAEASLRSGVGPLLGRTPIENALRNLVVTDLHSRKGVLSYENVLLTMRDILQVNSERQSEGLLRSIEDELHTLSESGVHLCFEKRRYSW
jgi:hypothetical protein